MEKVSDVQLPFFYGFYNSPYEIDDYEINDFLNDYNQYSGEPNVEFEDLTIDYKGYMNAIVDAFVECFKEHLPSWIVSIDNYELDSPQFYNYRTDEIYATITLADDWKSQIGKFVEEHLEWLKERIRKDWTSRSGFTSFIKTNIDEFMEKVYEAEPIYLSILIGYAIQSENGNNDMYEVLIDETLEEFCTNHSTSEFIDVNKGKSNTCNDNGTETTKITADDIREN